MADTPPHAIELTGGRMTAGVVRVGNIVRRPASPASGFVAQLLTLFEQQGFTGAPRYLGQSPDGGHDVFTYIPGDVPERFQAWTDAQVAAAGALLRAMHDASRGSALAGRFPVVCHHDPSPTNAVFRGGLPVAWIDFDTAAPGSALEDLGYAVWSWTVSAKQSLPVTRQAEQARILTDAYGLAGPERAAVVDSVLERQARNVRFWCEALADTRCAATEASVIEARIHWSRRELAFTHAHRDLFDAELC